MKKFFTFFLALAASVGMSWATTNSITINESSHGSVVASSSSAAAGETITLTATPNDGYQLKSISGVYVPVSETLNFVAAQTTVTGTKFQCVGTMNANNYGWRVFNTGTADSTLTVSSLNGTTLIKKIEFTSTWGKQRTNDMLSVSAGTLSFDGTDPSTTVTINDINATSVTISGSGNNAAKTWCIASVKVYYEGTDKVELEISDTENANVKTFTMVDSEVTISAEFEPAPAPEPTYLDADFAIDFRTDPYTVVGGGALPEGTVIAGTYHDNLHGYQNVIATVPVKAGKYRLTLGACEYDSNAGTVMSETNVELASFDQNLGTGKCYHNNTTKNIVSVIFDVDEDQHVAIQCGQYTPYMKLEAVTAYHVSFALGDAEGVAPTAVDVTVGEDTTMSVNKTMYKAGYTLTGWSDGVNTYAIGESFTPANDVVLTPVFTANEADLLNASSDVTVKWYFGGDNGAPTTSYEGTSGLLVAQATIGDKTVDVKLSIDATSGKFAPQATTEWAQVNVGTIFTYPYKEGITVNVDNYKSKVTYYIADAEGKVTCGENDYYSFIQVTYPASTPGPSTAIDNANANAKAVKILRDGQLLIERDDKTYNIIGTMIQ